MLHFKYVGDNERLDGCDLADLELYKPNERIFKIYGNVIRVNAFGMAVLVGRVMYMSWTSFVRDWKIVKEDI